MADRLELVCSCGSRFSMNARNLRRARSQGRTPFCRACSPIGGGRAGPQRHRKRKPELASKDELVLWWIEESGLELDELREIAYLLWPENGPLRLSDAA